MALINPLLEVFLKVVQQGSFTKAAETLYLSATAVMKQMNQLEEEVRARLFTRTTHGVRLTEAGESLRKDAEFMERYGEESVHRAQAVQIKSQHIIRLGTSPLYPGRNLMDLWEQVSDQHPDFRLRVVPFQDDKSESWPALLSKKYDLVVGSFDSYVPHENCRFLRLGEYPFSLSMPRSHRLAGRERLLPEDLHRERLLIMERGRSPANDRVRELLEREHPQITLEDVPPRYDIDVFNHCAESDSLLLTSSGWDVIHPSLVPVLFDVPFTLPYGILYAEKPSKNVSRFLQILQRNAQKA